MKHFSFLATAFVLMASSVVFAQPVQVEGAWVRASVPGQKATGAFMKITAPDGAQLLGGASPVAGVIEVHEMKMEGDVMRMRAVPALDLPAGKTVELKPGGYHIMLMDLKGPLLKDSTLPLTLLFRDARGVPGKLELRVPVGTAAPAGAMPDRATHGQHKH
jgi:periplasmic copper chaperone A